MATAAPSAPAVTVFWCKNDGNVIKYKEVKRKIAKKKPESFSVPYICLHLCMRKLMMCISQWGMVMRTMNGYGMGNNQLNQFKIQSKFNQFLCVAENMNNKIILSRTDDCIVHLKSIHSFGMAAMKMYAYCTRLCDGVCQW